jgi:hypothetical protein
MFSVCIPSQAYTNALCKAILMGKPIFDGWWIELIVRSMCEAHPCADEPGGESVAPIFQAFSCIVVASWLWELVLGLFL